LGAEERKVWIAEVKFRLNKIETDAVLESGYIEQLIDDNPFSPFPTIANSEKPDKVAAKLLEGRAAILVDGTPFVLTVPMLFIESFQHPEDYYVHPYFGTFMTLRLILLVVTTLLITLTTSPIAFTDGIEFLLRPLRFIGVPGHEIAMMMTIALRFVPTLMEEGAKIRNAQMARGADFETGNIFRRARSLVPLLVPLFISAFRRADELAVAMEARCYRGGIDRTKMRQLQTGPLDYFSLVTVAGFTLVLILSGV